MVGSEERLDMEVDEIIEISDIVVVDMSNDWEGRKEELIRREPEVVEEEEVVVEGRRIPILEDEVSTIPPGLPPPTLIGRLPVAGPEDCR